MSEAADAPSVDVTRPRWSGPGTGLMILLGLALATIALAGLTAIGSLIGPIFLALTLAITARPAITWLRAHRVPSALSTILVLLGMYAVAAAMVFAVTVAVSSLINTLPTYQNEFNALYEGAIEWLQGRGVSADQIATAAKKIDITSLIGIVPGILGGVSAASTQLLTLLLALAFLILDTADVSKRAAQLRAVKPQLAAALEDFTWRVRRYWVVSTIFGLMSASLDFVALLILRVPMPFTWALLAFVANYIPNIGFVVALVPVALLGLLSGGVSTAVWVIVAYCLINVLVQTVIQPRFIGNAVGLGTTLTFISLIFWAGIIGPLGAVLAVPLTLFFKAVIVGSSPDLKWLEIFLQSGDDPPKARA
ncbi:MAG TPA: AI-2E family transporter [Phycicoccus sp.]|nr:AI-2E family transporter [Phycicoccus sp.]